MKYRGRNEKKFPRTVQFMLEKAEESRHLREPLSDERWREIVRKMTEGLSILDQALIRLLARSISDNIHLLDATMSRYCEMTCHSCEDACCDGINIFYNQADLLYLIALGEDLPPGQTRRQPLETCRYLGPNGCSLTRKVRPYVCVWYLCDAQMKIFQGESATFQRRFISIMQDIRSSRIRLESLYERC